MKLKRFKVINFRSVQESDWIHTSDNSCLIGTNEAGKTNLLSALWKLNPANNEPIKPLDDFPRHLYSQYKSGNHSEDVFIKADFILNDADQNSISRDLDCDPEQVSTVLVQRRYDGIYYISFPYTKVEEFPVERIDSIISEFSNSLNEKDWYDKEKEDIKSLINKMINDSNDVLNGTYVNRQILTTVLNTIKDVKENQLGRRVKLPNFLSTNLLVPLEKFIDAFDGKTVHPEEEIRLKILRLLPKFVYYSDYGNLDSEIYLPRVMEDEDREEEMSESARAKQRTLNVLFKYVKLSPKEIFELGNDRKVVVKTVDNYKREISRIEEEPTEEEIQEWSDKKRERGVLLRSASANLTNNFKKWWQQGDYIFDFQADGNHFRINVSDTLRPEKIELEGRSRGLQWFFSFFLVFLVETKEGHSNAILLLDEPGLSLHPIAQYDLAKFFRKLSEDNQLIYTSHSPFLVDIDNLANVKAVYLNKETGRTEITTNLRFNEKEAEKSIYPVHAALGLTVSDTLLLGSTSILVEGPSDQIYLNLIKRILFSSENFSSIKEFVFIPTGGVRGMSPISKLVSSRDDKLPSVLLDSDKPGKDYKKKLISGRYRNNKDRVLEVEDYFNENGEYEIEDLLPPPVIIHSIDRMYRGRDYFEDTFETSSPIVPQIEQWADENSIELEKGWKVELARNVFNRLEKIKESTDASYMNIWIKLFNDLEK